MTVPHLAGWTGVTAISGFLLGMLALAHRLRQRGIIDPEASRKIMHVALGAATLCFPWLFREAWPALVVAGLTAGVLILLRTGALGDAATSVVHGVARRSEGDLHFPLAAATLFVLTGGDMLLYSIPLATLTFADPAAAIVGNRFGRTRYASERQAEKSVEGSAAFFVVALCITLFALAASSAVPLATATLIAVTFAIVATLLEASAWRGLDNLFIPVGGALLLRRLLPLDDRALATVLAITIAMVAVLLSLPPRYTTWRGAMARLRSTRALS